jgi:uncharacterized protein YoxC
MNDERMIELLKQADAAGGPPHVPEIAAAGIRRRIRRRRAIVSGASVAVAAVLLVVGLRHVPGTGRTTDPQTQRIASLEAQVRQLKAQTEETLSLVRDVLAKERQQDRLHALEAELASIPDPAEQMKQQAEKTAFTLVYQADRMYRETNQVQSAIDTYEQVIRLFPQNHWAEVAKQRVTEIKESRVNKSGTKGETKWQVRNETPLV